MMMIAFGSSFAISWRASVIPFEVFALIPNSFATFAKTFGSCELS